MIHRRILKMFNKLCLCVMFFGVFGLSAAYSEDIDEPVYNDENFDVVRTEDGNMERLISDERLRKIEIQVLKKSNVARIGSESSYETFDGIRFGKYFTIAQRVEIFQEARPIDSYILDAKSMRHLYNPNPWDTTAHFRRQITPLFTRAYGTELTMSDPDDSRGQIRYTHDYRDTYREYYPKYPGIKVKRWDQNEFLFIFADVIEPSGWFFSSNVGYRYSTINQKELGNNYDSGFEVRHTYFTNIELGPSEHLRFFGQFEYFKGNHRRSLWENNPDHFFYAAEIRMKTEDLKTSIIPRYSYSIDKYYPFRSMFEKHELSLRIGRDFTDKFSGTTQLKYVISNSYEKDANSTVPAWPTPDPYYISAAWAGIENRISYNIWKDFYIQAGLNYSCGLNMSDFDNFGTLIAIEYYKPGLLRVNFGWSANRYYNIGDSLSMIGVKFFIFM